MTNNVFFILAGAGTETGLPLFARFCFHGQQQRYRNGCQASPKDHRHARANRSQAVAQRRRRETADHTDRTDQAGGSPAVGAADSLHVEDQNVGDRESAASQEIGEQRDYSEAIAEKIDQEVQKLVNDAYINARKILVKYRAKLDEVATKLLETETMSREEFEAIFPIPKPKNHGIPKLAKK